MTDMVSERVVEHNRSTEESFVSSKVRVEPPNDHRVKSAARAIEMLEYFDEIRSGASVMEIARALNYPQSSTTELLKSLAEMGYLSYDPRSRRYEPTHRVALLGSWIQAPHLGEGRVLRMMEELSDETHETIILAEQPSTIVRYIYVVPSRKAMRLHVGPGTARPLLASGLGRVFLSTYPAEKVRQLLMRINAGVGRGEPIVEYSRLKPILDKIRRDGYYVLLKGTTPGAGVVSMMLPTSPGCPALGLGIGGFVEGIETNAEKLVETMKQAIDRHLR